MTGLGAIRMNLRLCIVVLLLPLAAAPGCRSSAPPAAAPKTLTVAEVAAMPLEESGDLTVRQNLVETPRRTVLGRDGAPPPRNP